MKPLLILFLCSVIVSCETTDKTNEVASKIDSEEIIELTLMNPNKNLAVSISMDTDSLKHGEEILINLEVENKNNKTVKLLFENPTPSFGVWATTASLIDSRTNNSKLKYANKAVLQSQVYTEKDLKEHYYYLKPGESIGGRFNLTDIVVLNESDQVLDVGSYRFKLYYYSVASNELVFIVK